VWQPAPNGGWRLHPRAAALRKWLPFLSKRDTFDFRDDVKALYVQDAPRPDLAGARTALFVRDPRDAIPSFYRRIRPEMPMQEFVRFLHPETLLDAIAHWRMFVECWLARTGIYVYRFVDYKAAAVKLLTQIVGDLGLESSPEAIRQAAAESTYEKARAAEERYRAMYPADDEVAMRAGRVGEWKGSQEALELSREIETRTGPLLARLGYEFDVNIQTPSKIEGISQLRFLSFFEQIEIPSAKREAASADPMTCSLLPGVLNFASTIDAGVIRRARLHPREARALLDSLLEYSTAWQEHQRGRVAAVRAEFSDGSTYHLTRIRELVAGRRAAQGSRPKMAQSETP
jgi:hypothetical protein